MMDSTPSPSHAALRRFGIARADVLVRFDATETERAIERSAERRPAKR